MAPPYRVQGNKKPGPPSHYERIQNIGGSWGKKSEDQAIREIEGRTSEFYVDEGGKSTEVRVAQHKPSGKKFLTTHPADTTTNNLLSLSDSPYFCNLPHRDLPAPTA